MWLCWPSSRRLRPHPLSSTLFCQSDRNTFGTWPPALRCTRFYFAKSGVLAVARPLIYPRPTTRPWTVHVTGTRDGEVSGIFYEVWHAFSRIALNRYHENKSCEQLPNIPTLVKRPGFLNIRTMTPGILDTIVQL